MVDNIPHDTFGKVWTLLEANASRLANNLRFGYIDGYEYELADELIGQLTLDERKFALQFLVQADAMGYPIAGALLDECDERSYEIANRIADILLDGIVKQGTAGTALRYLVTDHIVSGSKFVDTRDVSPDAMSVSFTADN